MPPPSSRRVPELAGRPAPPTASGRCRRPRRRPPASSWCATVRRRATCRGCAGVRWAARADPARGRGQMEALRDRLAWTGELAGADALYASVLPRAVADGRDAGAGPGPGRRRGTAGPAPVVVPDCGLCELHPGEADGLTWSEFTERFGDPGLGRGPGPAHRPRRRELDRVRRPGGRTPWTWWPSASRRSWWWWPVTPG